MFLDRDRDFEIRIGDDVDFKKNPLCHKYVGAVLRGPEQNYGGSLADCSAPLCGRYISVQRMSQGYIDYMHICEMEAFAGTNAP